MGALTRRPIVLTNAIGLSDFHTNRPNPSVNELSDIIQYKLVFGLRGDDICLLTVDTLCFVSPGEWN